MFFFAKTACRTVLIHVAAKQSRKRDTNSIYFMRGIKKKSSSLLLIHFVLFPILSSF